MTLIPEKIINKADKLPLLPGVYLFKNSAGKVLYVGKAKNLRHRVKSYFQSSASLSPKTKLLVRRVAEIDYIVTDNEVEALILENNLIKKERPYYNVDLKDDKTYPYIKVTREDYPRIFVTRKIEKDGAKYFGPFTQVQILRKVLRTLLEVFRIRTCRYRLTDENVRQKKYPLCLDYHIHRCDGPCQGLVTREEYGEMIEQAVRFLKGQTDLLIHDIKEKMKQHSKKLQFEKAKILRDRLKTLEKYTGNIQKVEQAGWRDSDIVAYAGEEKFLVIAVFIVRGGKVINRQLFSFTGREETNETDLIRNFIEDYYLKKADYPGEILLPREIPGLEPLSRYFRENELSVKIVVPKKGNKKKLLEMVRKNARLTLEELKLKAVERRKDFIPGNVAALQKDLNLKNPPLRIEGFDISNIQGTDSVASLVCFINGKPRKSEYRVFKIRASSQPDDFAMIREAVRRRYAGVKERGGSFPDLIVIDGGKGQLSSALSALEELGLAKQPVISLAKRLEEVFVPGLAEAQNIPRTSPGLKLLQQVRDETHRFALYHHRKQRKKRTLRSELEKIPGVGKKRRDTLLKYFGSLKKIKEASPEEIASVPGISGKIAEEICAYFLKAGEN
jgi:excinuclease ABC subunit C